MSRAKHGASRVSIRSIASQVRLVASGALDLLESYLDPLWISSLLLHFLFALFFLYSFDRVPKLHELARLSNDFIVLDSVQITDVANLKLKDTNASSSNQESEKKYSSTVKPDLNKVESVMVPQKIENVSQDDDGPSKYVPKVRKKPDFTQRRKVIINRTLKEDDELAGLLNSIDEKKIKGSVQNTGEKNGLIGKGKTAYNATKAVGVDVIGAIRSRFINCWRVPIAAMDIQDVIVVINVVLGQDGELISAEIADNDQYDSDPFKRVLADSALRAVHLCTPMSGLPKEQFEVWKNMQLRFNVADML